MFKENKTRQQNTLMAMGELLSLFSTTLGVSAPNVWRVLNEPPIDPGSETLIAQNPKVIHHHGLNRGDEIHPPPSKNRQHEGHHNHQAALAIKAALAQGE